MPAAERSALTLTVVLALVLAVPVLPVSESSRPADRSTPLTFLSPSGLSGPEAATPAHERTGLSPATAAEAEPHARSPGADSVARFHGFALPDGAPLRGNFGRGGPAAASDPVPYSTAAAAVAAVAAGVDGDSWQLVTVAGLRVASPYLVPAAEFAPACTLTWTGPVPTQVVFPATPPAAGVGDANAYLAILASTGTPALGMYAEVANGTASVLFTAPVTPACGLGEGEPALPTNVLDSPLVLTAVDAAGGSAFLAGNPAAGQEWAVASLEGPPSWEVTYVSPCGSDFFGEVSALNGTVPYVSTTGPCRYAVTFEGSGLVPGTSWSVTFNGSTYGTTALNETLDVPNGTFDFTVNASGFEATPSSGRVSVDGAAVEQPVSFVPLPGYFDLSFSERGLPAMAFWEVYLSTVLEWGSSNGSTINFAVPNGTYDFMVLGPSGYTPSPGAGTQTIAASAASVPISFASPGPDGNVTFLESGLPSAAYWTVYLESAGGSLSGTTTPFAEVSFSEPYGAYTFTVFSDAAGYGGTPSSGSVTVAATNRTIDITFAPLPGWFAVTFSAHGLPAGATFEVRVPGVVGQAGPGPEVTVYLENGSYAYAVESLYGYTSSPSAGAVDVDGGPVSVPISFSSTAMYAVTFSETGLPSHDEWSASLADLTSTSIGSQLLFFSAAGDLPFEVASDVSGWNAEPPTGTLSVQGPVTESIVFVHVAATYPVVFSTTTVPVGIEWTVTLDGQSRSAVGNGTIVFPEPNGTYPYSVTPLAGWAPNPANGTIAVQGYPWNLTVTFRAATTYPVTFSETGLAAGTPWNVTLNGQLGRSLGGSIVFNETPGLYRYAVAAADEYVPSPANGSFPVKAAAVVVPITFARQYEVTFDEHGLPSGTRWTATLAASRDTGAAPALSFFALNGSYPFSVNATGYTAYPASGHVTVLGALVVVPIAFAPTGRAEYLLTFTEAGLPSGSTWTVTVNGTTVISTLASVWAWETSGTYAYTDGWVGSGPGYTATPSAGTVQIGTAAVTVAVNFTAIGLHQYVVTLSESGLPAGTPWWATLNGGLQVSRGTTITYPEANGTYGFSVQTGAGYSASPAHGSVTVSGGPTGQAISFSRSTGVGVLGLPGNDGYYLLGGIAVLVAAAVAATVRVLRGRRRPPPAPAAGGPDGPPGAPPPGGGPGPA